MLRLVTGSPGDGKTSNELWEFLNGEQYKGRPKYCTPINGFEPEKHGVKPIEHVKSWQDLPEGSVIFCDEVQDFIGTDIGKEPPEWAKQLARHRHRGFDFIFTTQDPMYMHSFVRKLCKPHVHYTRPWNMKCFKFEWETPQGNPNAASAKKTALRKPVTTNPKVFELYTSTVLDTHKKRPPYKIIFGFAGALILASLAIWFAVHQLRTVSHGAGRDTTSVAAPAAPHSMPDKPLTQQAASAIAPQTPSKPVWDEDSVKPRIPGLPYTAPVYDGLTAPTDFPRVAACMASADRNSCNCYTQQATPIDVPRGACEVFVKHGSFDPWLSGRQKTVAKAGVIEQADHTRQAAPASSPVDQKPLAAQPAPVADARPHPHIDRSVVPVSAPARVASNP